MTFADLQARAMFLAKLAGWMDAAPAPDWAALVNRGVQDFSWDTEYNTETGTVASVSGQATYALSGPPSWKYIDSVLYGTTIALGQTTEQEELNANPLYLASGQTNGTPSRYYIEGTATLHIVPTPGDSTTTISYHGVREAPALVNPTDVPTLPPTYHEGYALRAVVLHMEPIVTEDAAVAKINAYAAQYERLVGRVKRWLDSDSAQIQRSVRARIPARINLSGTGITP